jgi:uncharacterized protein (DUF1800 family)
MTLPRRQLLQGLAVGSTLSALAGSCDSGVIPNSIATASTGDRPPHPGLAVIALNRMAFGISSRDLAAFQALPGATERQKFQAYLERQLHPTSADHPDCTTRLAGLTCLAKSLQQLWQEHYRGAPTTERRYEVISQPTQETKIATLVRAVYSQWQLQEVLADFWHNHFNASPDREEQIAALFASWDREVIRKHLFGNFRQMLGAVARHPVMLYYLDNATSNRAGPNENWARELFELHTLGAENYLGVKRQQDVPGFSQRQPMGYVDDDVYEATRAFTGWRVNDSKDEPGLNDSGTFLYYAPGHDRFQKTVLGHYLPPDQAPMQDGDTVLDLLAQHPGTARFICRKLARRLIGDYPPPAVIRQVVRTILQSEAFAQTWGDKIKRPFEVYAAMLRATQAQLNPSKAKETGDHLWQLGQPLFGRLPPDGYPDTRAAWTSTSSLLERWRWAQGIAGDWWSEVLKTEVVKQTPTRQPTEVLAFWTNRILARPLVPQSQASITAFIKEIRGGNLRDPLTDADAQWFIPLVVAAVLSTPDLQWR